MTGCRLETVALAAVQHLAEEAVQDKEVVSKRLAELKVEYFDGADVETAEKKKKYEESCDEKR